MAELFATGRIVDLLLLVIAAEAAVLVWLSWRGRLSDHAGAVVSLLLPGIMFLVALRLALVDAPWPAIAGVLALTGIAHAADVYLRFFRSR
ncbi:MAG: hypothetical protein AAFQ45_08795 [Pseudomonadota bacterium]